MYNLQNIDNWFLNIEDNEEEFNNLYEKYPNNIKLIIYGLRNSYVFYEELDNNIKSNRDNILEIIKYFPEVFPSLNDEFRDDEEIALLASKDLFWNFKYASNRIINDKDIVLKYLSDKPKEAIDFISEKIKEEIKED